jgi:gamma-glutamyltranspeptidase/glutathione hydrolase
MAALIALNILEGCHFGITSYHSWRHLHTFVEAIKLAFADALAHVADPLDANIPLDLLLSKQHAAWRRKSIGNTALADVPAWNHREAGDTFCIVAVDGQRNAISFINSLFHHFGAALVVEGTGIALNNRGSLVFAQSHTSQQHRPWQTSAPHLVPRARPAGRSVVLGFRRNGWLHAATGSCPIAKQHP